MIDICDFAVGQSRMLYGLSMHPERPCTVCTSSTSPLASSASSPPSTSRWRGPGTPCRRGAATSRSGNLLHMARLFRPLRPENCGPRVARQPAAGRVFSLLIGSALGVGEILLQDPRLPLISFTARVPTGRHAAETAARAAGTHLPEPSCNNAIILTEHADLQLALPAVVWRGGTAGQRCTTTRRLIVHEHIFDSVREALMTAYRGLRIGHPLDEINHLGPLIDLAAVAARGAGGAKRAGRMLAVRRRGAQRRGLAESGCYVVPGDTKRGNSYPIVQQETFGLILYLIRYSGSVEEAIALQNDARQGLSSAISADDLRPPRRSPPRAWIAASPTSTSAPRAEISGAFGGEKRPAAAGSRPDAWKVYMRRQTVTVNYGRELPLAQGIRFELSE
ncbi:MAG: aldehyde dehydrogenase family protein [Syntrophotaleaceae bacterium]